MATNNVNNNSNFFVSMLTVAFIVLKLTGVINWSWWWVLSPLWIGLLIAIPFVILLVIIQRREQKKWENFHKREEDLRNRIEEIRQESDKLRQSKIVKY